MFEKLNCLMKLLLIFIFISCFYTLVSAQTMVTGTIISTKNKPISGVSVTLKDTYDGATSDSAGRFKMETSESGKQVLIFSYTGFKLYEEIVILEGKPIVLSFSMKEMITELKAVVLTAGAFEAGDQKKGTVLNALDIVTTASAQGDVTGAIKTLPGTQQVGETEGLFVRGGTATESKIYIDGTVVNNFFYSSIPGIASRGRFNPFLFKGTVFSSGGYSALYGQALSSALILESKDLPERTEANLSLSVIGLGGGIQKLAKNKKSSWGVTYNYTNLWPAFKLIPQKQDFFNAPLYHNGDANFRIKTNNGFIKYYGYANWSRVGIRDQDIDSTDFNNALRLRNINIYQNIHWRERLGKGWKITLALSYSNNRDNFQNELQNAEGEKLLITNPSGYAFKNFDLETNASFLQGRMVVEKKLAGLNMIRFGADHFISKETSHFTLYDGSRFSEKLNDRLTAAFAETDVYLTNDLAAKVGTRAEYDRLIDQWNVAPRLSLSYKINDKSQASFAYGIFYQNPESKYLPAVNDSIQFSKAAHYIIQYQRLTKNKSFRAEIFYKDYDDLIKTTDNGRGRLVAGNNNGRGFAKGIEFFWRDKASIKNLDYWISYSYLDTKRDFLNYPFAIQPSFATAHTASLVMKKFVLKWKTGFNLSYTYATGRPYYQFNYNTQNNKYEIADQGKTIPYNNLAFSVNYLPKLGDQNAKKFIVWVLSISNVLGQKQVFSYNYATLSNRKAEVGPPSKRFVFIGCFISFGIDRTEDAINNNL